MKKIIFTLLATCITTAHAAVLTPYQSLDTSGARKLEPFEINGKHYLAVAQLATDDLSQLPDMNGGNANADVMIYQWQKGKYQLSQHIQSHGNEDVTFFTIGKRQFLAIASLDEGTEPPFKLQTNSTVYEWDGLSFKPFQQFNAFAAKKWEYFSIGNRHFLALANGVVPPNGKSLADTSSTIYEWDGKQFVSFQTFPTKWAYGFYSFQIGQDYFLGLTDHAQVSTIYRWDGKHFVTLQSFDETGGRAFLHFEMNQQDYLAYANISHPAQLLKWDGKQFVKMQTFPGLGSRNFAFFTKDNAAYLLKVNFITGPRENPVTKQDSPLYQWKDGQFQPTEAITTLGGVSANVFAINGKQYVSVANSLSEDVRFNVASVIYQVR